MCLYRSNFNVRSKARIKHHNLDIGNSISYIYSAFFPACVAWNLEKKGQVKEELKVDAEYHWFVPGVTLQKGSL